jgi:hypothetical protein
MEVTGLGILSNVIKKADSSFSILDLKKKQPEFKPMAPAG